VFVLSYHGGIHLVGVLGLPLEIGNVISVFLSVHLLRVLLLDDAFFEALARTTNGWLSLRRQSCLLLPKLGEYALVASLSLITRSAEGLRILPEDWRPKPRGSLSTSHTCNRYVGLGDRVFRVVRSAISNCLGATVICECLEPLKITIASKWKQFISK
jgi:hypothetical protein